MKVRTLVFLSVLLTALIFPLVSSAQEGAIFFNVSGVVSEADGTPVNGLTIEVTITAADKQVRSQGSGTSGPELTGVDGGYQILLSGDIIANKPAAVEGDTIDIVVKRNGGVVGRVSKVLTAGDIINGSIINVQIAGITVVVDQATLPGDGKSTAKITINVTAPDGTPVVGDTLTITPTLGKIVSQTEIGNGVYEAIYKAALTAGADVITIKSSQPDVSEATVTITLTEVPAIVTVTAKPATLVADGVAQAAVTITVEKAGVPIADEDVEIVATDGTVSKVVNEGEGKYTATYTASKKSGTVKLTATAQKSGAKGAGSIVLTAGPATQITVAANPTIVISNSTSLITATVLDANGNPVVNEVVTMEITAVGALSDVINKGDGAYTAIYTAPVIEAQAVETITATATKANITGSVQLQLSLEPPAETDVMDIEGVVYLNDGTTPVPSPSNLTVTVVNTTKAKQLPSFPGERGDAIYGVTFFALGDIVANSNDVIEVTVKDADGNVRGQETHVLTKAEVDAQKATGVNVTTNLRAYTSTFTIEGIVRIGNVFPTDTTMPTPDVLLVTVKNLSKNIVQAVDTEDGIYSVTFANDIVAEADDEIEVTVSKNGREWTEKHILTNTEVLDGKAQIDVQTNLGASNATFVLSGLVVQADGVTPAKDGLTVTIARNGEPFDGASQTGDAGPGIYTITDIKFGEGEAAVKSGDIFEISVHDADILVGFALYRAKTTDVAEGSATADVRLAGEAAKVAIVSEKSILIADGKSTSQLTATVLDANDIPVSTETVQITASAGAVGDVVNNGDGTYTATYASDAKVGDVTIVATATLVEPDISSAPITIALVHGPAAKVMVTAEPDVIDADGKSTSQITVNVEDATGNAVPDEVVEIVAATGTLGDVVNNGDGTYSATYTASQEPVKATLTATATKAGISGQGSITLKDDVPPVADAGKDQTVPVGVEVTLDGSGSQDTISGIVEFSWDILAGTPDSSAEKIAKTTYLTPGIYTATLTVTDAAGNTASDDVQITVGGLVVSGDVIEADGKSPLPSGIAVAVATHQATSISKSANVVSGRYSAIFLDTEAKQMKAGDLISVSIKSPDGTVTYGEIEHTLTQAELDAGYLEASAVETNRVSRFTIVGKVRNAQGVPIEGAAVTTSVFKAVTDANGDYTLVLTNYATNPTAGDEVQVTVTSVVPPFENMQKRKVSVPVDVSDLVNRGVENIDVSITPLRLGGLTIDTAQYMKFIDKLIDKAIFTPAGIRFDIRALIAVNPDLKAQLNNMVNQLIPGGLVPTYLLTEPYDKAPVVFSEWENMDLENFGNAVFPYTIDKYPFALGVPEGNLSVRIVGNKLDLYLVVPMPAEDVGNITFELSGPSALTPESIEAVGGNSITHVFQLEEEQALLQLPSWSAIDPNISGPAPVFRSVTLHYGLDTIATESEQMSASYIDNKVVWTASPQLELGKSVYYYFEVELPRPIAISTSGGAGGSPVVNIETDRWFMPDPRNLQIEDKELLSEFFGDEYNAIMAPLMKEAAPFLASDIAKAIDIISSGITKNPAFQEYAKNKVNEIGMEMLNTFDPRVVSKLTVPNVNPSSESLWIAHFNLDGQTSIRDGDYRLTVNVQDSVGDQIDGITVEPVGLDRRVLAASGNPFSNEVRVEPGVNALGYEREDGVYVMAKSPDTSRDGAAAIKLIADSPSGEVLGILFQMLKYEEDVETQKAQIWSPVNSIPALALIILDQLDPGVAGGLRNLYPDVADTAADLVAIVGMDTIKGLISQLDPVAISDLKLAITVLAEFSQDVTNYGVLTKLLNMQDPAKFVAMFGWFNDLSISPFSLRYMGNARNTVDMLMPAVGDYWVRAVPFDDVFNLETSDRPTHIKIVPAEEDIVKIVQISLDANSDGDIDDPYEKSDYNIEPPQLYTIFFSDDPKATLTAKIIYRTVNPLEVSFQYALESAPDEWKNIKVLTADELKGKGEGDIIEVDWMFDEALKANLQSLFESSADKDKPLVFVRAVATNALSLTDPSPYVADVLLDEKRPGLPGVVAMEVEAPQRSADSGAPMGTVMLNAYTSTVTIPDIKHILFEISSDSGETWQELGPASTFEKIDAPQVDVLQAIVERIASGEVKEVSLQKTYNKWTLKWDTTKFDDTITYHPDVATEEDEGRDYTKDKNFPPGPYMLRAVTVDVNGVRQDEYKEEPKAPAKAESSVDNVDDVPPLTGTQIVDIRREEDINIFSDNLLPAEEVEVYARIQVTAKPKADPAAFEKIVLLIKSEDGSFEREYELGKVAADGLRPDFSLEIDTRAEEIPNGRYTFQAIAVDNVGNREVIDESLAQKVTIANVVPPTLADISLVQVAGAPVAPITLEASVDLRPVSGVSILEVTNVEAASAMLLVSDAPLNWNVQADINLGAPSIIAKIQGEPKASFTFVLDVTSLPDGQYYLSFIFRSGPPVVIKDLMDIAAIVDNTGPKVVFVAPIAGSTLGPRPVIWTTYQGTGSLVYKVALELKDESGNTVLTSGIAEGAIEGEGAAATYVKPSLSENGFSIDEDKLIYKAPELLEAGGYTATVTVTDLARNSTESEISFAVGQDTSPPIIMVTSPQGTITVSEVILSVSAVDDTGIASVTLKLNGAEVPNVQLADGVATAKVTDLKSGEQQVEAEVIDKAGNKASVEWSFIVRLDAIPPQISVVSPQGIIRTSETTISVSATDESGIDSVSIKLNGAEVPDVVLADGVATAKVADLKSGEQQVEVEVTDKAGNKASAKWSFTVELDATSPQIVVVSPQGTVRSSSATITVSATDDSGIDSVVIKLNGAEVPNVQLTDGVATASVTDLQSGEQQVEVEVSDTVGNKAQAKWSFTVELDTTPPQITVTSPQGTIYKTSATISATVTDESGIKGKPTIKVDGAAKSVTFSNSVATANATGLGSGEHQVEVAATDNAGNTASAKWSFTVKLDTTPPQITAISPLGTIYKDSATISATIIDESGIKTPVTIKLDGTALSGVQFSDSVAPVNVTGLTSGERQVEIIATDNAGNTASAKWSFTVMLDSIPPAITAISPLGITRVEKPNISVAVSDDMSGVDSVKISLQTAAKKTVKLRKVSSDESSATYTPSSALKAGTYTAAAEAQDVAGNSSSAQWSFVVEFDVVPPAIIIVSPQDGARMTETKPTISASYSDNLSGVDAKSVRLELDAQAVTAEANTSQVTYTPTTDLSIGTHTIKLEVSDNDDNKATASWSFVVEAETSVIMNARNYPNPFIANTTIAFTLSKQAQVTIKIFDLSGRLVNELKSEEVMEAGPQKITWDGKSENGDDLARGVYFGLIIMKTELEPQQAVLKMALTR